MQQTVEWRTPPAHPRLSPEQVHLWLVPLLARSLGVGDAAPFLSADEQERAGRFYFERDRRRYTVARTGLRRLLAAYLGCDPRSVEFSYGAKGKPFLAGQPSSSLSFNLSHAGELAVMAFSLQGRVGVDIEEHRRIDDLHSLAASVFSPREQADFHSLPPSLQVQAFYDCWTRKEAFIKAIGDGLSYPLDQFDVTLLPGEPARLLHVAGEEYPPGHWQMAGFMPAPGFSGAVVVEGAGKQPLFWRLGGVLNN